MSTVRKEYMQGSFTRGLLVFVISGAITLMLFYQIYAHVFGNTSTQSPADRSVAVETTSPRDEVIIPDTTLTEDNSSLIDQLEVTGQPDEPDLEDEPIISSNTPAVVLETVSNELLAFSIINQDGSVILDLRSAQEYAAGWIRTSTNYDVDEFTASDFVAGANYILICQTGTCPAAQNLAANISSIAGSVAVLDGGFAGWENEGGYRVMRPE